MFTKYRELMVVAAGLGMLAQAAPVAAQSYDNSAPYGGGGNYNSAPTPMPMPGGPGAPVYVPAGLTMAAALSTAISTDAAHPGDLVSARLTEPLMLGNGQIPAGSELQGHITSANAGGFLTKSGRVTVKFDRLRTPSGVDVPMSAHIVGNLGKYQQQGNGSDTFAGETGKTKVGQALLRTAIGAGAGAALGTAVGAIAGHGMTSMAYKPMYGPFGHSVGPIGYLPYYRSGAALGAGRGAWSGAAIGGGVGLADGLIRKGHNVVISSGTPVQLQLDAPMEVSPRAEQFGNS